MRVGIFANWGIAVLMTLCLIACNEYSSLSAGGGEVGEEYEEIIDRKKKMLTLVVHSGNDIVQEQLWDENSNIGLFLTKDTLGNVYDDDDLYSNIKAIYKNGKWEMTPEEVVLTDNPAIIYAYSPYKKSIDPTNMEVECTSGEVYMYGTHGKGQWYVRKGENKAFLNLYKTQALIDFRIRKEKLEGNLILKGITIRKKNNSQGLPIEATVNIQTGEMTYTRYGQFEKINIREAITENFSTDARILMPVLPFEFEDDEVEIIFYINNIERKITLHGDSDWKAGMRNIINLTFSGEDIFFDVNIKKWDTLENKLILYYN